MSILWLCLTPVFDRVVPPRSHSIGNLYLDLPVALRSVLSLFSYVGNHLQHYATSLKVIGYELVEIARHLERPRTDGWCLKSGGDELDVLAHGHVRFGELVHLHQNAVGLGLIVLGGALHGL